MRFIDDEISIGDYVLTGGELPAMVLADTVFRLVPGVVKEPGSLAEESFQEGAAGLSALHAARVVERAESTLCAFVRRSRGDTKVARRSGFKGDKKKRPDLLK